jgi:hypothetical protein
MTTREAGIPPASDMADIFRAHGAMIAALPEDVPEPVDDDDEVWIETLATSGPVGIPHDDMAAILGTTLEAWLAPADDIGTDDDDDMIDWEH